MNSPGYSETPETGTAVQKRNRKPVSCTPCRQRKLRCDQAFPFCDSCVRRGDVMSCSYQHRRAGIQRTWPSSHSSSSSVQNRMDRLEQLVLSMINQKEASEVNSTINLVIPHQNVQAPRYEGPKEEVFPSARPGDPVRSRMFRIDADYGGPHTNDEAHWVALLNEIHEVRSYLQTQQHQYKEQSEKISRLLKRTPDDPGPTLLFGASQLLGHGEILAHIPSRYTCDMFVERYFRTLDPALHILHPPTFQKQYTEHWEDPNRTSVVWIGLLFAMMRIAALSWQRDGDEPLEYHGKSQDLGRSYRTRVADCILLADYTKPHEDLIETLVLHLYGEYASHREADSSTWVLLGTIIRLAMRMGYHRDPDHLPSISPFQAEMRRRVWTFIRQADILFSFQHGFPSMVKVEATDRGLPRNIYDGNFGPASVELPAPLPDSEATSISYLICKARLALGLSRALKELNREDAPPPYERVLEIDRSIREIYAKAPDHFRLRSMAEQQHDQVSLVAARFALANVYHKALCVVHSRFLEAARIDARFYNSRRACLESAMALLKMQAVQHQEIKAGGQARCLTKYMTSLTTHDYLLAATILCTELSLDRDRDPPPFTLPGPSRNEMIESLDRSAVIWNQMRDESIEAYRPVMSLEEFYQQRTYPTPASMPMPEIEPTRNLTQMYPGTAIDTGLMATPPPQQYVPRDRLPTRYGATGAAIGSGLTSTVASTAMATPNTATAPSVPMLPGFDFSSVQHTNYHDSSTTWEQFAAPLDFSDPVSALWALDPSRRGT